MKTTDLDSLGVFDQGMNRKKHKFSRKMQSISYTAKRRSYENCIHDIMDAQIRWCNENPYLTGIAQNISDCRQI